MRSKSQAQKSNGLPSFAPHRGQNRRRVVLWVTTITQNVIYATQPPDYAAIVVWVTGIRKIELLSEPSGIIIGYP